MLHAHHDKDDNELLRCYKTDGNNEWLGILLPRYTSMLLGVCMKYLKNEEDAKDSVQQIFLKVINELKKYDVVYFKSWLYMIAKNHCLMKLRSTGRITTELKDELAIPADENEQKLTSAEKENKLNDLEAAITHLNEGQRVCVTSFYLEKKTYQQITESTGLTLLQVKSNIQNGKRNLKIIMESLRKHEQ